MKRFAALLVVSGLFVAVRAQGADARTTGGTDGVTVEKAVDLADWQARIHDVEVPGEGCFEAAMPDLSWKQVPCAPPLDPTMHDTAGGGYDWSGEVTSSSITSTKAVFTGYPYGSISVVNCQPDCNPLDHRFAFQINSNKFSSSLCNSADNPSTCRAWQQFIYHNEADSGTCPAGGGGACGSLHNEWVLIGYNSGSGRCPDSSWNSGGGPDCYRMTAPTAIPAHDINYMLAGPTMTGKVQFSNLFYYVVNTLVIGTTAYTNSYLDLANLHSGVWFQSEANVLGHSNSAQAAFSAGTTISATVYITSGSGSGPICVDPSFYDTYTGETNNLNLHGCTSISGTSGYFSFSEGN